MELLFLQRNVHAKVRVLSGLIAVIEREKERVDEENPMKALGIEVRAERDAIGQARFDVELVENAVPIRGAARFFGGFLFVDQPFGVFWLKIIVGIAEKRLRRGDEFRIGVAQTENGTLARRRG